MTEPRAYTTEEIKELFLKRVWVLINYWSQDEFPKQKAVEGLAFSILAELDGEGIDLPGFAVIPMPNGGDKFFFIDRGENYFPDFKYEQEVCDIGGNLHELFHQAGKT